MLWYSVSAIATLRHLVTEKVDAIDAGLVDTVEIGELRSGRWQPFLCAEKVSVIEDICGDTWYIGFAKISYLAQAQTGSVRSDCTAYLVPIPE